MEIALYLGFAAFAAGKGVAAGYEQKGKEE
jgi:hypothetical protein